MAKCDIKRFVHGFFDIGNTDTLVNIARLTIVYLVVLAYVLISLGFADVDHYYVNISSLIDCKQVPYRDTVFEYPPLALLIFLVPKLFSWNAYSFGVAFTIWAYIVFLIGVYFAVKIADHCKVDRRFIYILALIFLISMNQFVITRYDVFAAVLVIIAVWFFVKENYVLTFIVLGIATMTKLYPLIFAAMIFFALIGKRDWKNAAMGFLLVAEVCLIVELPFFVLDASSALDYLSYHSARGIQVESTFGAIFEAINIFVPGTAKTVLNYGSLNLTGYWPDAIAPMLNKVMGAFVVAFMFWACYRIYRNGIDGKRWISLVVLSLGICVLIGVGFSKVYSAQYFIWILALFPVVHLALLKEEYLHRLSWALALFTMFSFLNGTVTYGDLSNFGIVGITVNVAKNVMLFVLLAKLIQIFYWESGPEKNSETNAVAA